MTMPQESVDQRPYISPLEGYEGQENISAALSLNAHESDEHT